MNKLDLSELPDVPQWATIVEIASKLWNNDQVQAIWIGGSLARNAGDAYSDIDFRIAVAPQQLEHWKTPDFAQIFFQVSVVGQTFLQFGDDAFLHHLVLSNGEILDFFAQSTGRTPTAEPLLVLYCRDPAFAQLLAERNTVPQIQMQTVNKEALQQLFTGFWINTHKHRKVLHRGLDLMVTQGIHLERQTLLRLWYIQASGEDCGDMMRQTIHSLTAIVRTLEQAMGSQALELVGAPIRNRQELIQAIEHNRTAFSQVGQQLAQQYEATYPSALEATALQGWQEFLES